MDGANLEKPETLEIRGTACQITDGTLSANDRREGTEDTLSADQERTGGTDKEEENVVPVHTDGKVPADQEKRTVPADQDGTVPASHEGTVPANQERIVPADQEKDGTVPANQKHADGTVLANQERNRVLAGQEGTKETMPADQERTDETVLADHKRTDGTVLVPANHDKTDEIVHTDYENEGIEDTIPANTDHTVPTNQEEPDEVLLVDQERTDGTVPVNQERTDVTVPATHKRTNGTVPANQEGADTIPADQKSTDGTVPSDHERTYEIMHADQESEDTTPVDLKNTNETVPTNHNGTVPANHEGAEKAKSDESSSSSSDEEDNSLNARFKENASGVTQSKDSSLLKDYDVVKQSEGFDEIAMENEGSYWIHIFQDEGEHNIEAVLLFHPSFNNPQHFKSGLKLRESFRTSRKKKHVVLVDLSHSEVISFSDVTRCNSLCGVIFGNTTNNLSFNTTKFKTLKEQYERKLNVHIWMIKKDDFACLKKKVKKKKKILISHKKPMKKDQQTFLNAAYSKVKTVANSAFHYIGSDIDSTKRIQQILLSEDCSLKGIKEVIDIMDSLRKQHGVDNPRYIEIIKKVESIFNDCINEKLLLCLGVIKSRNLGKKWEERLYKSFKLKLEEVFSPSKISHHLKTFCENLKNDGRDHEILKNIADGSIAVYNDWCTKPSDLKEVEDYIFRLMFWCSIVNNVTLILSGEYQFSLGTLLSSINWISIKEDLFIQAYSRGIVKGFDIRDQFDIHQGTLCCNQENAFELFCPNKMPFTEFSVMWIVLRSFREYFLSKHINFLKLITDIMCTARDAIKSSTTYQFRSVGYFLRLLFEYDFTRNETEQWVSMVVQFILDSGELSIFVEFRDSANVAKYWKYMKDKVSLHLKEKEANRSTLQFVNKVGLINMLTEDVLTSYMERYEIEVRDDFSDIVWHNTLTILKENLSDCSQVAKGLLQKIMDFCNRRNEKELFFTQILGMHDDSDRFFDSSLRDWCSEEVICMKEYCTTKDILSILIKELKQERTRAEDFTLLQEVVIDIILEEVITEETLQSKKSEQRKMFCEIVKLHKTHQDDILLLKFCAKCVDKSAVILKEHWDKDTIKYHFDIVKIFYESGTISLLTEAYHGINSTISMDEATQEWISSVNRVLNRWLINLKKYDVTYEDCSILKDKRWVLIQVYSSLGMMEQFEEISTFLTEDLQLFKKFLCTDIKDEILPFMEGHLGDIKRICVTDVLSEYGVKLPYDIDNRLKKMILPNCSPECVDSMCKGENDEVNMCYKISPDFKLDDCMKFYYELIDFLEPLQQHKVLWFSIKKYPLLSKYVMAFLKKNRPSESPIKSLSTALTNTKKLICKIFEGSPRLTWGDYTIDELELDELGSHAYIVGELKKINATTELYDSHDQVGISTNIERYIDMLVLIRTYVHISNVIEVCQQYDMKGCLDDKVTAELKKISGVCETRSSRHELSPETAGKYLRTIFDSFLLEDSSDHMIIFDKMKKCKNFHTFIMVQFFANDQDESTGANSFHTWYDIISNQLQNLEFEREILNHLFSAFEYILPFVNKSRTLKELMSEIKKLNADTEFKELQTVSGNMHHIENWSSRAEGDFTVENVRRDLESIMSTGFYSYQMLTKFTHGHPFEIVLKFTAPKGKNASGCTMHEEWRKEQISDFEQKLALMDDIEGKDKDIQCLIKWNEIARRLLAVIEKLYELGYSKYQEFCNELDINKLHIEEAEKQVMKAEQTFVEWREKVDKQRCDYKWLLLLTTNKVNRIFTLLKEKNTKVLTQEICHLFYNTPTVRHLLYENIEISEDINFDTPFEAVGKYLNNLLEKKEISNHVLPRRTKHNHTDSIFGGILHIAIDFTQSDVIKLLLTICQCLPESYDVLYCGPNTTAQDLVLFTDRCRTFGKNREFYFLEINRLLYEQQEVLMNLYQNMKRESLAIHFIETEPSLLREVPGICLKEHEVKDLHHIRDCVESYKPSQEQPLVQLVYGPPGVGKTYFIRQKKLPNLPHYVIIAMNETFSVKNAIQKLSELSGCENSGVFFSFTINDPGDSIERGLNEYKIWIERASWFFFQLLVTGYVEDTESGESFQLPAGCGWKIYIEVPSGDDVNTSLSKFIYQQFPVFAAYGKGHCISADDQFDIDEDALIVYKYLRAYNDGRINSLYIKEVSGTVDIQLSGDELSKSDFKKLMEKNNLKKGFGAIIEKLFEAYHNKLIKRVYLQDSEVRFAAEKNPTDEECWCYIYHRMPHKVQSSKILQKLYIRYLSQRFNFLENFPGYNRNTGAGLQYNSVALGKTLVDAMIAEVNQMCDQQSWASKVYQQLIYDDGSGTFGYISVDLKTVPTELAKSLSMIGVDIPNDMRLMKDRGYLDSCLARALGIQLEQNRLKLIDECDYVLTLDFATKMLNIHERRKCGIPVIIEGETGVGKTFLIEMLSKLWNYKYATELKSFKEKIVNFFAKAMKSEGDIQNETFTTLSNAIRTGQNIKAENIDELLEKHQDSISLMKNALKQTISHDITSLAVCQLLDNTSEVNYMDEAISSLMQCNDKKQCSTQLRSVLNAKMIDIFHKLDIHAALTTDEISTFFGSIFIKAERLLKVYRCGSPDIVVYLDEINTSSCLGLLKEIIIDGSMNGEAIPSNIFIIASCNPFRGDSTAISHCAARVNDAYFVCKLHPTLSLVKWDYGALSADEEHDYIKEKLTMLHKDTKMKEEHREILIKLVVESQKQMRELLKKELKEIIPDRIQEIESRASCYVSQRDIQRVIKFYIWLLKVYKSEEILQKVYKSEKILKEDDYHRSALLVSLGLVYYLRLPENSRKQYVQFLDNERGSIGWKISFEEAFKKHLEWYSSSENLEIPAGIAKTEALKENLLAVIMCCATRTPLIIEGAPGTSKTLSFNIAVANLKGKGSRKAIFQNHYIYPALEPQFYQCSRRTNSEEIRVVFKRATEAQKNRTDKNTSLSVVFMDEAGLPERDHEPLKILHYYLEHPQVSFVAITNHPLDAAKTNRAISVYRPEASASMEELSVLAKDCLGIDPQKNQKISKLYRVYKTIMKDPRLSKFYGLRDFIYFLIHLCGKIDGNSEVFSDEEKKHVLCSIERNFGGSPPADFKQICEYFFKSDHIPPRRSVVEVLGDSLKSPRLLQADEIQYSIQSNTRFQLIIDPSEDQSITRLLFTFGILDRSNTKMIVCSNLPGDIQKAVSTIAKIRHSAQKGNSVILSQVDDIQESFYDLFNQRFRCVYIKKENRYYANISCGSHSRLSRIHPNFCCSVILRESDLTHTPGPFLNRFEKYYMSYDVLLDHSLQNLPGTLRSIMKAVYKEVLKFAETLGSSKSFYGYSNSTISSLLIKCLPVEKMESHKPLKEDFGEDHRHVEYDGFIITLEMICSALKESGFKIVNNQSELEEAEEIFESLKQEGSDKFKRIINDLRKKPVNEITMRINDVFDVLYNPKKEALPVVNLIIIVMVHFLIRYFCKCLMQVLTPEGLALHHKSIPQSFCKFYMDQQEHFSLKSLISNHIKKMNQSQIASKILCYTRSSSLTSKLFPEEYHHTNMSQSSSESEAVCNNHIYDSEKLTVWKFSNRLSQQNFEQALRDFFNSQKKEVFLFVVGIQESTRKKQMYVNHVRIIMEQEESDHMRNGNRPKKLLILLLLFPPRNFIKACYPCIFLEGWEHCYLDSISQASYEDSAMCKYIEIRNWFRQFCLQNSTDKLTHTESYKAFLQSILSDAIPVLVSRLRFGNNENFTFNKKMEVCARSTKIKDLLEDKGIGEILVERFQSCWNPTIVSDYIQKAALHTFDHDSTLNLADQIQVLARFLFIEFLVYMIHVMNRNMGLDTFFFSESVPTGPLFKKLIQCIPIPELHELEGSKYYNLILNDMKENSEFLKPVMFPYFHHIHDIISKIIDMCKQKLIIERNDIKDEIWLSMATKEWKTILVELESKDELFLTTLFSQVECDEREGSQNALWNLYIEDFFRHKFFLDPQYKLCSEDIEILKHRVDSSDKKAIADRFFNLHIQIAINRLKLTQALPTLRRVHELRSSYKMEVATAESHFSSDVIIKMLFDYLKDCINTENSEDKLSSWYDLFIEIALFKEFFYSDLRESRQNMATILWLCYLTIQCAKYWSTGILSITQRMFHMLLECSELHLSKVLVEGIHIIEEVSQDEKGVICMFSEGVLEHYFSEYIKEYNTTDVKWYLRNFKDREVELNRSIAIFFLKRILTTKCSFSPDNVLCLFEDQARLMIGSAINAVNEVDQCYIPTAFYAVKEELECDVSPVENPLADMYFEIIVEILADKCDLSPVELYQQCNMVKEQIDKAARHDEIVLLLIEKEALIHSLMQCLAKGDHPEMALKERLTINMSRMICTLLSESMPVERSFAYAFSLFKNHNIRSTSKLIRVMKDVMKDKDSLAEHRSFIKPFINNIPNEYSVQRSWHSFSFLNDPALGRMYKDVCVMMSAIKDKDCSAITAELRKLSSKSISDDEIYKGITGKRAFIMSLWLCIYHNFFCKKISSTRLAQSIGEVLKDQYRDEYLNILKSFIDPENYATEKKEPPISFDFTPDDGVFPRDHSSNHIDSVYELFTILEDNDERMCYLRHTIANIIAVVFALPPMSNHIYYHLIAPDQLPGTYVTGYMIDGCLNAPLYYDCGVELTITGDYGQSYYSKDVPLRTEYLLLLISFSAFVVNLYTQPDEESRIHGKVISPKLPVRNYCTKQLFISWHHLQQSMNMSVEEVALLVTTSLEKFIEISDAHSKESGELTGLYHDKFAYDKCHLSWTEKVLEPSYSKSCELSQEINAKVKALSCLKVLDREYPHHFHTYIDLEHLRRTEFTEYSILFKFLKYYNQLKYGGDLLPDLMRFYQWIHHDLSNLITEEDASTKSIQTLVLEYSESDQSAYLLYERVKEKYNRYVAAVGEKIDVGACAQHKRLNDIADDTKLMAYLSIHDGDTYQEDRLLHVIVDIMKVQTQLIEDVRKRNKGLECFFTKHLRTIHPLEINEEECIVGAHEKSDCNNSHLTQLIRRRWKCGKDLDKSILQRLEIDIILHYLANKPKILDTANIRKTFLFKRKMKSSQDEAKIVSTKELCEELRCQDGLKVELTEEQCKELDFIFHSKDYENLYRIQSGLRNIADHIDKELKENKNLEFAGLTIPTFLYNVVKVSTEQSKVYEAIGLEWLSLEEQEYFESIQVSQLCDTLLHFIKMIEDGYYDFHSLPIGLKKRLAIEDIGQLEKNLSNVSYQGELYRFTRQFQVELDALTDVLVKSEDDIRDTLSECNQISIVKYLAEDLQRNRVVECIPESMKVENYVHLRVLLRRYVNHQFKKSALIKEDWKIMSVDELWREYLPEVKHNLAMKSEVTRKPKQLGGNRSTASDHSIAGEDRGVLTQIRPGFTSHVNSANPDSNPGDWTVHASKLSEVDVGDFLRSIKLDRYAQTFLDEDVDGKMLADIIMNDKKNVLECLEVKNALHIQKIYSKFSTFCFEHAVA